MVTSATLVFFALTDLQQKMRGTASPHYTFTGISRSTAAAFTALCLYRPSADEEEIAWELREASPSATPNRLIVSLADDVLGRSGRMVRAIEQIGRGADAFEGTPFVLRP